MEFSDWLKGQIKESGMSVIEFAQRSRISKPMIYFFQQGKRLPTPTTAAKIAEVLHVPLEDVMVFARQGLGRPHTVREGK